MEDGRVDPHRQLRDSSCAIFIPRLSGKLRLSWKLQQAWLRLEPAVRALPLPPVVAAAYAGAFMWWKRPRIATLLAIGFAAFLRTGEQMNLERRDFQVLPQKGVAIIALRSTKTGQRESRLEFAAVRSRVAVGLIIKHVLPLAPYERVFDLQPAEFNQMFRRITSALEPQDEKITLYSVRRGGASHDFLEHGSLEKTLLRGRWASARSARIYVQDAVAALAELQLSETQLDNARLLASFL